MKTFMTVLLATMLAFSAAAMAQDVATVDKDELKAMLGTPDLVVLDVRAGRDWSSSEFKIQGAIREDPGDVSSWSGKYDPAQTIVLYCA